MEWLPFLSEYKGFLGGFSIAVATVCAVLINLNHNRRAELRLKRERNASFSSAIASELIDNAHNLMDLYFQISSTQPGRNKINSYKQFSLLAYEKLLDQIGQIGPELSFMVVDVYGDIRRMKINLDLMTDQEVMDQHDEILPDVQEVLIKTITISVVMYFYADYMSGKDWMRHIMKQRMIWLERTLYDFCMYVDKTDIDLDFLDHEENPTLAFYKRFRDPAKREKMQHLLEDINAALTQMRGEPPWRAQLSLKQLSVQIQKMLQCFLQ